METVVEEVRSATLPIITKLSASLDTWTALGTNLITTQKQLEQLIDRLNNITAGVEQGKGTAGKLLKSDELSNQIQATIGRLDGILDKINAGQGTIGQLLVNTSLYDNLNGTTREMHELMKDFRANPKKFLRIKLGLF